MSASKNTVDRPVGPLKFSKSEAIVAVLAGAVAADGVLKTEEARRLNEVLATTRWVFGLGKPVATEAVKKALDAITEHGVPKTLKASADVIPAELHATTFALAVDLLLADGRLGSREGAFIDQLQTALGIHENVAGKILDVLLIKNRASGRPDV